MMKFARQTLTVVGSITLCFGLGAALLVWPGYRDAHRMRVRLASLADKVTSLPARAAEVERLVVEVDELHRRIDTELRVVPPDPDIAGLFRQLSLPVDGITVADQTFSSGSVVDAVPGGDLPTRAMPVTVNMEASFDSVFALVRSAESMSRLVRVSSVLMSCERPADEADAAFLTATVDLEAIYEPDSGD